jgi:uncharacterized protein HemX
MKWKPILWVAATIALVALPLGLVGLYGHYMASQHRKMEQTRELTTRMKGLFKARATLKLNDSQLRAIKEEVTQLSKDRDKLRRELRESDVQAFFRDLFRVKPRTE